MVSITLENLTLDFPIYGAHTRSLKRKMIRLSTGGLINQPEENIITVRAIDDLSLQFSSGEVIGLIGHNGAGKSTLLRVLAGIYEPTLGQINITGKVSALLDVSLGMDSESTGYENIYLSGMIRGFSRTEIAEKTQEIAEFTALGDYLSMPIRTYSDGMRLRLAFSLATSLSSEILIMDEIIGIGDETFMRKAQKRLDQLVKRSELVVFASHSEDLIRRFCNKVLWMNAGKKKFFGDIEKGLEKYNQEEALNQP